MGAHARLLPSPEELGVAVGDTGGEGHAWHCTGQVAVLLHSKSLLVTRSVVCYRWMPRRVRRQWREQQTVASMTWGGEAALCITQGMQHEILPGTVADGIARLMYSTLSTGDTVDTAAAMYMPRQHKGAVNGKSGCCSF